MGNPSLTDCWFSSNDSNHDGGGMYNWAADPTLVNCVFVDNSSYDHGGGVYNDESNPTLVNCAFLRNVMVTWADAEGGGMCNKLSSPTLTNCLFSGNEAREGGAGMDNRNTSCPTITNCTFTGNWSSSSGAGIKNNGDSIPVVTNCVLWGNIDRAGSSQSAQFYTFDTAPEVINYSCLQNWTGELDGIGNTGQDPLLADADGPDDIFGTDDDDVHLLAGSPCINTGNDNAPMLPDQDFDGQDRIQQCRVDMGADESPFFVADCNSNGTADACDIEAGTSGDCTTNGIPDECEPDCNSNGSADNCDIAAGTSADCNSNTIPDECDIAMGSSNDCLPNGVPDECEPDCDDDGIPDECELAAGTSTDCNTNTVPDECDIADGTSNDCNANALPDECDLSAGTSKDCQPNDIPDECELTDNDCNTNTFPDDCDIATGHSADTNTNGLPDECEIVVDNVRSCRQHSQSGWLCVDIGIGGGRVTGDNVEPRRGGVHQLQFDLSLPVSNFEAAVDCQTHDYEGSIDPIADGTTTIIVEFAPPLPNNDCCTVTLTGEVIATCTVAILLGDIDRDLDVTDTDYQQVRLRLGQPANASNCRYDVNADGDINSLDYSSIKLNMGAALPGCPWPGDLTGGQPPGVGITPRPSQEDQTW